ncbi:MAG: hypothetical protein CL688_05180 [Candidatus Puniceispirillum sp.]|nr:hypothetical protein [Candidatus Puniceispirillum sp.]
MTAAIWALVYEISNDDRQSYLNWFHQIHIPEKLARPGYCWAAHFEGSATTPNMHSYIALFGGLSTRIFLDPSPAQLKTKQDGLTREMIARRCNSFATILAHEWSDRSTPNTGNDEAMAAEAISSGRLDFLMIDAADQSEAIGAWIVQNLLPKLQSDNPDAAQNAAITHKFISVTGAPAHILFHETNRIKFEDDVINFDLGAQILTDGIEKAPVHHRYGKRIWPV